jgi:hypothetical protein
MTPFLWHKPHAWFASLSADWRRNIHGTPVDPESFELCGLFSDKETASTVRHKSQNNKNKKETPHENNLSEKQTV